MADGSWRMCAQRPPLGRMFSELYSESQSSPGG